MLADSSVAITTATSNGRISVGGICMSRPAILRLTNGFATKASLRNLDRHGALRGLFSAENPDHSAECADDKGYRTEQQRDVDALARQQPGISERKAHRGFAHAPAGN